MKSRSAQRLGAGWARFRAGADALLRAFRPVPRKRLVQWCGWVGGLLTLALVGVGVTIWQVQSEKNSEFLRGRVLGALTASLGENHAVKVEEAGLTLGSGRPVFSISGLSVTDQKNGAGAEFDVAELVIDPFSLWRFAPEPTSIRVDGLRVILPQSSEPLAPGALLPALRGGIAGLYAALMPMHGPFPALKSIEGRNIALLQRNAAGGLDALRSDFTFQLARRGDGEVRVQIGHEEVAKAIVLVGRADSTDGLALESKDLTAGVIFGLLGGKPQVASPDMRLGLRVHAPPPGGSQPFAGALTLFAEAGTVALPDPDIPPFHVDEARLDLRIEGQSLLRIEALHVRIGEALIRAEGMLNAQPEGDYRLRLEAREPSLGRLSAKEAIPRIDHMALEGVWSADLQSFRLERAEIRAGEGSAQIAGRYSLANGGLVETQVQAQDLDLRTALRIWPISIAPPVRAWLVSRASAGRVRSLSIASSLAGQVLHDAFNKKPIPDDALRLSLHLDQVSLQPLPEAPVVSGVELQGGVTGRTVDVGIARASVPIAKKAPLELRDGRLLVADFAMRPVTLELRLPMAGQVPALMDFLSAPPLRPYAPVPGDIVVSAGVFEGNARVLVPLVAAGKAAPTPRVEMRADMRDVVVENVVKGERLERGTFQFQSRAGVTTAKGEGRLFGVPTQMEFRSEPDKVPQLVSKVIVDDALRQKRGFDLRPAVSGPANATFTMKFPRNAPTIIEAEFDLIRVRLNSPMPGLTKSPGEAGRLKFTILNRNEGTTLDALELDAGGAQMRGKLEFNKDGQFQKADFASFRLSPGDNASVQLERVRNLTRVQVRGNAFDLRPFLKSLQSGKSEDGKAGDLDVSLRTTVLVGFHGELMNAADLVLSRRNGRLSQLRLAARFGSAPVVAETTDPKPDSVLLRVDSADAGAVLRFLDIYSRMQSGQMNAEITVGANSQRGVVQVRDFHIRNEPALRQFAGNVASSSGPMRPSGPAVRGDDVHFTKLRADFARNTGRLELAEAVMWGAQVGGSLDGLIDYAGDRVDLKGVLVPAYALNNMFSQIPILGPIFGGSQYEGLFAVPFVISGKASAPLLRINPVSVIAPGIFRKFFELQREGGRR